MSANLGLPTSRPAFCFLASLVLAGAKTKPNFFTSPKFIGVWRSAKCFLFVLAYNALAPGFLSLLNLLVTFLCYTLLSEVVPFGWLSVELKDFSTVDEPCFIVLFL